MAIFRLLTLGFGAGAFGACILALVNLLFTALRIQELIGLPPPSPQGLARLYQIVVWGGIWGLLFAIPFLNRAWWLKGLIIGALATLAILLYFDRGVMTPPMRFVYVLFLNAVVWGLAAGAWWALVSGTRKNGRKFGTFMR